MPNPGLSPERMALQSAYTEAEATQEVIDAALACLAGRCEFAPDFDTAREYHGCKGINNALKLYQTYKGVK